MDIIQGPVQKVIDGDTFEMRVNKVGTNNALPYNDVEKIRDMKSRPEAGTRAGDAATLTARRKWSGKTVQCSVHTRDTFGRLVCNVRVIA